MDTIQNFIQAVNDTSKEIVVGMGIATTGHLLTQTPEPTVLQQILPSIVTLLTGVIIPLTHFYISRRKNKL